MTTPELVALLKKNPVITLCAVLSVGILGGMYYRMGDIEQANEELETKSTNGRRYQQNVTNAVQLTEQFDALVAANSAIENRLIRVSDRGINQQYFFKLESETGVKIVDNVVQGARGAPAPNGKYAPVLFSLTAQGDFAQVVSFLRALENGAHYCRVVTASCSGGRKGPVTLTLSLELLSRP